MTDYTGFIPQLPTPVGYHEDMTLQELQDLLIEMDRRNLEAKLRRLGIDTS